MFPLHPPFWIRLYLFVCVVPFCLAQSSSPVAEPSLPAKLIENKIELLAEQSAGGRLIKNDKDQVIGVTLDRSCADAFKASKDDPALGRDGPLGRPLRWSHLEREVE